MSDDSFLYFTQNDIIEKISIDPRLTDSFKRVMIKLQEYFNANGYTEQRNYKEYLQKYLLDSGENNLKIYMNEIKEEGVEGFYRRSTNEICINVDMLKGSIENLDSALCHEFTHFLVMHSLTKENSDPQIFNGGFINEALTEMMTQQMYPNSNAYDAQVAMQKFANLLSGNVNNYSRFLKGYIDARFGSPAWVTYVDYANAFQSDFNQKGYINIFEARNNENFIKAQRELIRLFARPSRPSSRYFTFEEYCECVKKLIDRPVRDQEFINQTIETMEKNMIESLGSNNYNINEFLKQKLIEVRVLIKEQKKYEGKKIYEFTFAGRKISIDNSLNVTGELVGIQRGWNPNTRIMTFELNGKKMQFNVDELDFDLKEKEIHSKFEEFSSYYSENGKKNMTMLEIAMQQTGELSKIEKFTLPIVELNGRKTPYTIYVATYADKIVLLNNYEQIKSVSDIRLNEFIGTTSRNPKYSAIYSKELDKIENGIMFSTLNEYQVLKRSINYISNELSETLSQEELERYITKYKASDYIEEDDEDTIRYEALLIAAKEKFESLTPEQKQALFNKIKEQGDKFILSTSNGKIDISTVFGDEFITAYKGESQVLYDVNGAGIYNTIFDEYKKTVKVNQLNNMPSLAIDSNGNIQIGKQKEQFEEITPEQKQLRHKGLISQVEQLLGIQITSVAGFVYDNDLQVPRKFLKDTSILGQECGTIIKRLEQLFYEGNLDFKTYNDMKLAIFKEYRNMASKAPKPTIVTQTSRKDNYQQQEEYEEIEYNGRKR